MSKRKPKYYDLLMEAWAYCDEEDKSTEFMLQYMQDVAQVDLDTVMDFLQTPASEVAKWRGYPVTNVGNDL